MSQAAGLPTGGINMTPLPRYKPDNYTLMGSNDQNVFIATSTYRVSSKTVPTWLFALLSASTHANYKSWVIDEKFRKIATR